jgi:hypothetical protein
MLALNPADRPSLDAVLAHPFFWPDYKRIEFVAHVAAGLKDDSTGTLHTALEQQSAIVFSDRDDWALFLGTLHPTAPPSLSLSGRSLSDLVRVIANGWEAEQGTPAGHVLARDIPSLLSPLLSRFPLLFPTLHATTLSLFHSAPSFPIFSSA